MRETRRIEDQMKRAFSGEAWHGPSLLEVLAPLDARRAAARPIRNAHSSWEIVLHLEAWQDVLRRRLGGEDPILTEEQDWPRVQDPGDAAWQATLARLRRGERRLRRAVRALAETRLDEPLVSGGSSAYRNLHGHVQHLLYHAGQIVILQKRVPRG